jgi:cytochrome oxidase Cu insertion factor (SCO1/SenC/PrrC family)
MTTKVDRVFEALVLNGEELTAKQIAARYNVANPHDVVYQIRHRGYAIYLNEHVDTKGRVTQKYRFGTPSRALIAAGYKAMAAGLV